MVEPRSEFDAVVAAGIAHDDRVVAQHSGEGVHAIGGSLVRRVGGAELQLTPLISGDTDEGVAIAEARLGDVGLRRIAGACPGGGCDGRLRLDLVNEIDGGAGDRVRAAVTEDRLVGRQIRLPTYTTHRTDLLAALDKSQSRVR